VQRLKALALVVLLMGGSLGLPVADLIVWHLGRSHPAVVTRSEQKQGGSEQHDRQCVFTHQMPSPRPAAPPADALSLCPVGLTRPVQEITPRLISAQVQRAHPPRAPPTTIA
jgi:hypothetical protein